MMQVSSHVRHAPAILHASARARVMHYIGVQRRVLYSDHQNMCLRHHCTAYVLSLYLNSSREASFCELNIHLRVTFHAASTR